MKNLIITVIFALSSLAIAENALSQETIQNTLADIANDESYALLQEYAATVTGEEAELFIYLLEERKEWVLQQWPSLSFSTLLIGALAPPLLLFLAYKYLAKKEHPSPPFPSYYGQSLKAYIVALTGHRDALEAYKVTLTGRRDAIVYNLKIYRKLFGVFYPILLFAEVLCLLPSLATWIDGQTQLERIDVLLDIVNAQEVNL